MRLRGIDAFATRQDCTPTKDERTPDGRPAACSTVAPEPLKRCRRAAGADAEGPLSGAAANSPSRPWAVRRERPVWRSEHRHPRWLRSCVTPPPMNPADRPYRRPRHWWIHWRCRSLGGYFEVPAGSVPANVPASPGDHQEPV